VDDRSVENGSVGEGSDPVVEYPVTERVRIVGAQPAAEAIAAVEVEVESESESGTAGVAESRSAAGGAVADPVPGGSTAPESSVPDLPPWTDPPTGQVPAILDRGGNEPDDPWTAALGGGPAWREHPHEWDDMVFEPSLLGDSETRLGAIDDREPDELNWQFPDADPNASRTASSSNPVGSDRPGAAGTAGPGSEPAAGHQAASAGEDGPADRQGRNLPVAVATGLGFAAVTLICMHFGPLPSLALVTVVVVLAAAEAYGVLRRAGHRPATLLGLVATVAVMLAAYADGVGALPLVTVVMVVGTMLWYLFRIGRGPTVGGIGATVTVFVWVGLLGSYAALLVTPTLFAHRHGIAFLFGAIAAVVGADVGALATGKWLGRHPLAPTVSPNKTWEGVIGGAVLAVVLSIFLVGHVHPWTPGKAALLGVVVAVLAPLGDLCQSLVKRDLGLKDMGTLLPGHGGLMDRFDALLFVLPATFYLVRAVHLG